MEQQQEYEPLCSGAVKSILKKTNRVSFSTMDQTKLFFRVDPPADINKVRPSINGSSALGEILGRRESLHERKVFRLTRAFEPEPRFASERLIEASFVRDDSDQFSGDEDDPRRTVAVIHFGQDFRNTYYGGASMEPRVLEVTIRYSRKRLRAGHEEEEETGQLIVDQTEDDYSCTEDDDSVTGYREEDGFAASSLPFQYEEGQKCRDYPYWENGTECPFYIAQDESSSRYPDVRDEDSACRDLVADVVVTGSPLISTPTDGPPPDTPSALSPTARDEEVKSEDDRPATKTEIDALSVRVPASYTTKSSSPKSSRRPSWLQKMLMAV